MSKFYNRKWRMANSFNGTEDNNSKFSNYSMSFDGSSEYIDLGNVFDNVFTSSNFTVSTWIYATANTSYNNFFNKGTTVQFYLFSNKIQIYLAPSSGGIWPLQSTATLSLNTWHNIIFTRSGNENKLYINGTLDNSATSTGSISSSTGSLTIGAYSGGTNYFWEGKLDHCCLFDYALTQAQITALYGSSSAGVGNPMSLSPIPVAYYPLGDYSAFNGSEYLVPNSAQANIYSRYALNFDAASSDYIDLGTDSSLDVFGGNFSVSLWFNRNDGGGNARAIIEMGGFVNKAALTLGFTSNTGVGFAVGSNWYTNAGSGYNDGNWHNMIATRTGTTYNIYIDNVLITALSPAGGYSYATGINAIGKGTFNGNFQGSLSNISIWNAALTSAQVTEIYSNGLPSNLNNHSAYSNLVSWWQLGENSSFNTNWIVLNEISTGPNGVSVNMAEDDLVNGVGTSGNGISSGMGSGNNIVGQAPFSDSNALSINMPVTAKSTSVPS